MRISAIGTTGIYCRPGCPARPLEKNRTRYQSATAAEVAGYRACLRCRPDREPEVLHPAQASDEVRRLLRALTDGEWPGHAVDGAEFVAAVGGSPAAVAAGRRARFARRLLEQTDVPIASVATAVGLPSVAELERLLAVFGFGAQELRRRRFAAERDAAAAMDRGAASVTWTEPYWQPNDIEGTLGYLATRAIPGVAVVVDRRYRRVIRTSVGLAVVEVQSAGEVNADVGQLRVSVESSNVPAADAELLAISASVRRAFALDTPAASALAVLIDDPVLGSFVSAEPGRRLAGAWDRFETAIRIIIGQQVTVAAASTLTGRVVDRCRPSVRLPPSADGGLTAPFPAAAEVATADLAEIGMPRTRIATIGRFAEAVVDGSVNLATTAPLPESVAMLSAVKGIGPWTAELIAARVFNDPDAFPPKDLGLRRAFEAMGGNRPVEMAAEHWRPWRAAAIPYLWARA